MGNRMGRQQQVLEVTSTFGKGVDGDAEVQEDDKPALDPISEVSEVEENITTPDYSRLGIATPFADPRAQHIATYNVTYVNMN